MSTSSLSLTGTIGGVQISSLISAQDTENRAGAATLLTQEAGINIQTAALTALQTSLNTLYDTLGNLSDPALYESKAGTLANPALGTVSVSSTQSTSGSWDLDVLQVATNSTYVGQKVNSNTYTASSTLSSVFGSALTLDANGNGTFRVGVVNGMQQTINITASSTIQSVLDQINAYSSDGTPSGTGLNATFTNGEFSIQSVTTVGGTTPSATPLLLSAGTSNFLQEAQLFNNYSVISNSAVNFGNPGPPSTEQTMSSLFNSFQDGTFSVNGVAVNVTGSMKLSDVINEINAQVPDVTAQSVNGQLVINSESPVAIANGTGSFFKQSGLTASTATATTSQNPVGTTDPTATLATGGSITINGVEIDYDTTDTLNSVLQKINNSQAGVVAVYDSFHDRIGFVSNAAGPNAITINSVTGSLAGMGIVNGSGNEAGTFTSGNSAVVSVNGGASITSSSNTFTSDMLGIAGVTLNASAVGDTTLSINPDTSTIEKTIDAFVVQYNATQTLLSQYTDPNGTTIINPDGTTSTSAPGVLVNDSTVNQIGFMLRSIFGSALYGSSSASVRTLSDLGIEGNSSDNTATTTEPTLLNDALTFHLNDVINVFANPLNGLYSQLSDLILNEAVGGASAIGNEISNNNQQITDLDDQIEQINERADAQKTLLEQEYANYESTYSTSQSTSSFLSANTGSSSSSSSSGGDTSGVLG